MSVLNKIKHGLDFNEAQLLWLDPYFLEVPARSDIEPRFMLIGKMHGKVWAVFITYRAQVVRLISARRARKEEVKLYERV